MGEQGKKEWSTRTLPLLQQVEVFLLGNLPGELTVEPPEIVALSLCYGCVSRFQALLLLLSERLVDDAVALLRPLLADSQRLAFIRHKDPESSRRSVLLGLWKDRVVNARKLAEAAKRTKQSGEGTDLFAFVASQERMLAQAQQRYGIQRLERVSTEGASMASALGRTDDEIDYLLGTFSAHSRLLSPFAGIRTLEKSTVAMSLRTTDFGLCSKIGARAAELALDGFEAALEVLAWRPASELEEQVLHLRSKLAAILLGR
jgi:hypothetical protein